MCRIQGFAIHNSEVKYLSDIQDPKHTLFYRKIEFVGIYAPFQTTNVFLPIWGGGVIVCFLCTVFLTRGLNQNLSFADALHLGIRDVLFEIFLWF